MADLNHYSMPKLVAVVGEQGSGKDSYGEHLAELGYLHISAGDVLRERARTEGYSDPLSRDILSEVGDRFKQEFGPSPIIESSLANYEKNADTCPAGLVISGLRRAGELEAFKKHGAVVLWINASVAKRFENQRQRNRAGDHEDLKSFIEQSQKESLDTAAGSLSINLQAVEALADCKVNNDGTLEELFTNADQLLTNFSS